MLLDINDILNVIKKYSIHNIILLVQVHIYSQKILLKKRFSNDNIYSKSFCFVFLICYYIISYYIL